MSREHVTGIGGVFFRARDPKTLAAWYEEHLGVPLQAGETYAIFPESRNTVWGPFTEDTDYWPAEKQGMVNFIVDDLDAMLAQLRAAGVEVDDRVEELEGIGRFGWALRSRGQPLRALAAFRLTGRQLAATRPRRAAFRR